MELEPLLWPILLVLAGPALLFNLKQLLSNRAKTDDAKLHSFQRVYLSVYFIGLIGDWLQGPNVYRVYEAHGLSIGEIGVLFVTGYGSSALFGTFASGLSDVLGRRFAVVCYGVLYAVACVSRHFPSFFLLWLGRVVSGVCTSLLTSCFEAWMVNEHRARKLPEEGLRDTFALQAFGSGAVAIAAGLLSNAAAARGGVFAPFDLAAVLLLLAALAARLLWTENYGSRAAPLAANMRAALRAVSSDRRVLLLGACQTLFEAPMFIFVFLWTPSLAPPGGKGAPGTLPHGLVFACFMGAVMCGGTLFRAAAARGRVESILPFVFALGAACLATPVLTEGRGARLGAFLAYEGAVGAFWPCLGSLRSRLVPEGVRATVVALFRVPLNVTVLAVLLNVDRLGPRGAFATSAALVAAGLLAARALRAALALPPPPPNGREPAAEEPKAAAPAQRPDAREGAGPSAAAAARATAARRRKAE